MATVKLVIVVSYYIVSRYNGYGFQTIRSQKRQ